MVEDSSRWIKLIAAIGDSIAEFTGLSAAQAIMRAAGREFIKKSLGEIRDPVEAAINMLERLGFLEKVVSGGDGRYFIRNCRLAEYLEANGREPGKHPLCYFGFGLIEGCFSKAGKHTAIKFISREGKTCVEWWHD